MQTNSVQYTICKKWINKRCNGVGGDLSLVADGYGGLPFSPCSFQSGSLASR